MIPTEFFFYDTAQNKKKMNEKRFIFNAPFSLHGQCADVHLKLKTSEIMNKFQWGCDFFVVLGADRLCDGALFSNKIIQRTVERERERERDLNARGRFGTRANFNHDHTSH